MRARVLVHGVAVAGVGLAILAGAQVAGATGLSGCQLQGVVVFDHQLTPGDQEMTYL